MEIALTFMKGYCFALHDLCIYLRGDHIEANCGDGEDKGGEGATKVGHEVENEDEDDRKAQLNG